MSAQQRFDHTYSKNGSYSKSSDSNTTDEARQEVRPQSQPPPNFQYNHSHTHFLDHDLATDFDASCYLQLYRLSYINILTDQELYTCMHAVHIVVTTLVNHCYNSCYQLVHLHVMILKQNEPKSIVNCTDSINLHAHMLTQRHSDQKHQLLVNSLVQGNGIRDSPVAIRQTGRALSPCECQALSDGSRWKQFNASP